jgi:cytochrome c oxidase subunit 6a
MQATLLVLSPLSLPFVVLDPDDGCLDLWRKITVYIAIPSVVISLFNAYKLYSEHHNHAVHGPLPEEKIEFPYQNIRTKAFWWGDGDKTLFWNDKVNYHGKHEEA